MPTGALTVCRAFGCRARVVAGYCPAHADQAEYRRGSQRERGYTRRWQRVRLLFLEHHPCCGDRPGARRPVMSACWAAGVSTPATEVDHVVPHRGDVGLFWDQLNNWQALCHHCHARKTFAGL